PPRPRRRPAGALPVKVGLVAELDQGAACVLLEEPYVLGRESLAPAAGMALAEGRAAVGPHAIRDCRDALRVERAAGMTRDVGHHALLGLAASPTRRADQILEAHHQHARRHEPRREPVQPLADRSLAAAVLVGRKPGDRGRDALVLGCVAVGEAAVKVVTRHLEYVVLRRHDHVPRVADHEERPVAELVEQLGQPREIREVAGGVLTLVHPLERPAQTPPVEVRAVAACFAFDVVPLRPVDAREHHPGQLAEKRREQVRAGLGEAVGEDARARQEDVGACNGAVGGHRGALLHGLVARDEFRESRHADAVRVSGSGLAVSTRPRPPSGDTDRVPPIIVTGSHRAGTGWVASVLATSPRPIGYVWEPFSVLHRPGTCAARFEHWFPYVCAENEADVRGPVADMLRWHYATAAELAALRSPKDAARMVRDVSRFARNRRRRAVPLLKDPIAVFSAEWLHETFAVEPVLLVRHPAAFAASIKRLRLR